MCRSGLACLAILLGLATTAWADIKLQSVDRKISLNSQFARISETIKLKNTGSSPIDRVVLCQAKQAKGVFAHQKIVQVLASKARLQPVPVSVDGAPSDAVCWSVELKEPVAAGQTTQIDCNTVIADAQTAYPAEVSQGEQQLMLYYDNVYVVSPYTVSSQTTEVALPNKNIQSFTEDVKPVTKSDSKIKYGKYDLVQPFTMQQMRLHFENPKHFKKITTMTREIEVSHWGNIYVEENFEVINAGAKHKGPFSRLKYSYQGGQGNSFQELRAKLPATAHSLYYVDTIGNISTSDTRKTNDATILDFATRYPLMGGWKTDIKLGYSLPLRGFLSMVKGGKRRLSLDFASPIEGTYVADMTVKVVLPEGSTGITTELSLPGVEESREVKYTYLDVTGRPVVVLNKGHLVPEHGQKLHITYSFPAFGWLREPFMLIAAFATLFFVAIVWNRLEFTIARDDKWHASKEHDKLATLMQVINNILEEQDEVVESVFKVTATVRDEHDADEAHKEKSSLEATFNSLENKARALCDQVSSMSPRVGDKVKDMQARHRELHTRCVKQLQDRCDLARKGTPVAEMIKKLSATSQALKESRKELAAAVENLFAPY